MHSYPRLETVGSEAGPCALFTHDHSSTDKLLILSSADVFWYLHVAYNTWSLLSSSTSEQLAKNILLKEFIRDVWVNLCWPLIEPFLDRTFVCCFNHLIYSKGVSANSQIQSSYLSWHILDSHAHLKCSSLQSFNSTVPNPRAVDPYRSKPGSELHHHPPPLSWKNCLP